LGGQRVSALGEGRGERRGEDDSPLDWALRNEDVGLVV